MGAILFLEPTSTEQWYLAQGNNYTTTNQWPCYLYSVNVEWFEFESYHEMNPVCGVLYLVKCLSERLLSLSYKQKSKKCW